MAKPKQFFVAATAAIAVAAIVLGIFGSSQGEALPESDTSPSATPEVPGVERVQPKFKVPKPDYSSLTGHIVPMFDKLTIPQPRQWEGATGGTGNVAFADTTTCAAALPDCPHITFVDLASPANEGASNNPISWWAKQPCLSGTKHKVEGPLSLKLGGEAAKLYRVRCGADVNYDYAWIIPGKQVLVIGNMGAEGALSPEAAQAALNKTTWTG